MHVRLQSRIWPVDAFNLRFPGQYYDVETGKHYNYFRDYDSSVGRYIESDPIGLKGGLNTYGYVRGSPLNLVDRRGLFSVGKGCCNGGGGPNDVGQQVANACKMVANNVTNQVLSLCIMARCEKASVSCDGLWCNYSPLNPVGWNNPSGGGGITLCVKANDYVGINRHWGCVAIHEWAETCGWAHGDGGGIPGNSGSYSYSECKAWGPLAGTGK